MPLTVLQAEVQAKFDYDPISGVFRDKATGKLVGTLNESGYLVATFKGKLVGLHRLAFAYMVGAYPSKMADHINGIRDDNRWCNLRPANATQNAQNRMPTGKCGFKGASLGADGRWRAKITVNGVLKTVPGSFDSAEQAGRAYKAYAGRFFGQYARIVAPITGIAPAQDDKAGAYAQLAAMKRRREDVAQQLADVEAAIAALENKLGKDARGVKAAPAPVEEKPKPAPIKPLGTLELRGLEKLKQLNEKSPIINDHP